jgi:leader peptidase (prepilin peptidase)/N-methyltransferase
MAAYLLAGLVGLALGSFLNVVITRLPQGEAVWAGRSRCPRCRTPLPWHDNLPFLSYLRLGGRCRFCGAPISWRYPAVELTGGLLAVALWARFPGSPLLLAYGPLAAVLVVLTVLDFEHRWIPDAITLPGIALGLALSLVLPHPPFLEAALGAAAGATFFAGVNWVYERWSGRRGMGGGDVKLLALIGAFLGVRALPEIVLVSAALGSLAGLAWAWRSGQGRHTPIPYGPYLAMAAVLHLLAGNLWSGFWG